ncbi:MAG: GDSL-type esterase/lipase family protein [Planctomycetota bacterium]
MPAPRRLSSRLLLLGFGLLFSLVVAEIAARVWVAMRWPAERVALLTTHSPVRGKFASHPNLPFVLNPAWEGHNSLGLRGPELQVPKPPGVRRVACVGASTTYGLYTSAEEAYPARLAALLAGTHGPFEAMNAGVPGWVSTEWLTNFVLRVLPLEPDAVVVLEGRNEVLAQAYNGFRPDYTHYRRAGFNYTVSNYGHKELFGWSRLAMVMCTLRGERFGWSETAEHPLYGGLVWENKPDAADLARNLGEPARLATYRRCLETIVGVCKSRGIPVVLCTMALRPEKLAINELEVTAATKELFGRQVEANNACVREVADALQAPLAETSLLREKPQHFEDDCHLDAAGHQRRAEIVYDVLAPLLPNGK